MVAWFSWRGRWNTTAGIICLSSIVTTCSKSFLLASIPDVHELDVLFDVALLSRSVVVVVAFPGVGAAIYRELVLVVATCRKRKSKGVHNLWWRLFRCTIRLIGQNGVSVFLTAMIRWEFLLPFKPFVLRPKTSVGGHSSFVANFRWTPCRSNTDRARWAKSWRVAFWLPPHQLCIALQILRSMIWTKKLASSCFIRRQIVELGPVTFGKNVMAVMSLVENFLCP